VTVRWLRGATLSLRAVHAHVAVENREAARRVVKAVRVSVTRLREFPESGKPGTVPGTRELVVRNLPYVVVYRVVGGDVEVVRVLHTSTDWHAGTQ
jgi:plasmid stabilization system protein ParE